MSQLAERLLNVMERLSGQRRPAASNMPRHGVADACTRPSSFHPYTAALIRPVSCSQRWFSPTVADIICRGPGLMRPPSRIVRVEELLHPKHAPDDAALIDAHRGRGSRAAAELRTRDVTEVLSGLKWREPHSQSPHERQPRVSLKKSEV